MPNWKKVIVSGSNANLFTVSASSFTGSFTGSLQGTSSYSNNTLTSSYALTALSASYAPSVGGGGSLSSLTAATTTNTINNGNNTQTWRWDSLSGVALNLYTTSSQANGNSQTLLNIDMSGSNSNAGQATYGAKIYNSHTGTSSTNIGLNVTASGGTNNCAILINSTNNTPTAALEIHKDQNSSTQSDNNGILLSNSSAATAGLQSISPPLVFQAQGWKTTGAGSQDVRFRMDVLPTQGSINPTGTWRLAISVNGGSYNNLLTVDNNLSSAAGRISTAFGVFSSYCQVASNLSSGTQILGGVSTASTSIFYRTTNGGSDLTAQGVFGSLNATTAGFVSIALHDTNGVVIAAANGTNRISRAAINITNLVNTAASESADLAFYVKSGTSGSAMSERFRIDSLGGISNTGGVTSNSYVELKGGTTTRSPLNIASGTNTTTATAGSIEYNGDHYETKVGGVRFGKGGTLYQDYTDRANAGTGETDLETYTTHARTLNSDGARIAASFSGFMLGHASNTRQIKVYFAGTAIFDSAANIWSANTDYDLDVKIIRSSSSTARCCVVFTPNKATPMVTHTDVTGITFTNTNIIKVTGQSTGATNDIIGRTGLVEYIPVANN